MGQEGRGGDITQSKGAGFRDEGSKGDGRRAIEDKRDSRTGDL